ncbi:hypothetical protein [Amycolatopsis sp. NPDC021455]|uniref:hypothetical protein n=1 Tax=Amycolatopsis sp. NPDC021455 TaxID=3154901 RepID=UPI0034016041
MQPDPEPRSARLSVAESLELLAAVEAGVVREEPDGVSIMTFWADPPHLNALDVYANFNFIRIAEDGRYVLTDAGRSHLNRNYGTRDKQAYNPRPEGDE